MLSKAVRIAMALVVAFFVAMLLASSFPAEQRPSPPVLGLAALPGVLLLYALLTAVSEWWLNRRLAGIGVVRSGRYAFTAGWLPTAWIRRTARSLPDAALLGAWHLPEHRAAAKAVIEEELVRRGIASQEIHAWLPPASHTDVKPAFETVVTLSQYRRIARSRTLMFGLFRWIAVFTGALLLLQVATGDNRPTEKQLEQQRIEAEKRAERPAPSAAKGASAVTKPGSPAASAAAAATPAPKPKDTRPHEIVSPDSPLNPKRLPPEYKWIGHALEVVLAKVFPVTVLAFVVLIGFATWRGRRRALRVLLLRPFGQARMTSAIKRFVLNYLGPHGLVYTLEDRNYRPHWLMTGMNMFLGFWSYFISPLTRQAVRIATVKDERTYLNLALSLKGRWWPSFRSFLNGGQAFNVRTTNDWWQTVIDLLMNSSDVIVMDVSRVSRGSAWEIDRLEARNILGRCLFVVQRGFEAEALASVGRLLPASLVPKLFVYEGSGKFADSAEFEAALSARMKDALASWSPSANAAAVSTAPAAA